MGKIGELLSDGESMKQLSELAKMLMSSSTDESGSGGGENSPQEEEGCGENDSAQGGGFPDIGALMKLGTVVGAMNQRDKNTELLLALKPHLREDKQQKVDKAVKLLKLLAVWNIIKDSGMLKDLL